MYLRHIAVRGGRRVQTDAVTNSNYQYIPKGTNVTIALYIVGGLLALLYVAAGLTKTFTPKPKLQPKRPRKPTPTS